ncbi:MAG: hypothetical protein NT080_14745 [Spirochaetes bacterium]|nr:hypothetical protein [Spirochaetota bacterium]
MRNTSAFLVSLVLALAVPATLTAQEGAPSEQPSIPSSDQYNDNPYEVGENLLAFNLGCFFPMSFYAPTDGAFEDTNLKIPGAAFSISYLRTVTTGFAIGGEIGGSIAGSVALRTLFMAPFLFKTSWIFVALPFEFMPTIGAGFTFTKLQDSSHIDPILKLGCSWFWRATIDWSFGLNTDLWTLGQFYSDPKQNRIGFFGEATLSAVYHF